MQESQPPPLDGGGIVGLPKGSESVSTEPAKITTTRLGTLTAVLSGPKVSPLTWPLIDELPPCSPEAGDGLGMSCRCRRRAPAKLAAAPGLGGSASSPLELKTLWFSGPPVRPLTRSGRYLRS